MPNHTDPLNPNNHDHHKVCSYHAAMCDTCPNIKGITPEKLKELGGADEARFKRVTRANPTVTKRSTFRITAKPPSVEFEKERTLMPGEQIEVEPGITVVTKDSNTGVIRLREQLVFCTIKFNDREPERSESGKAVTIHQCEAHLVVVTWDEVSVIK